MNLFDDLIGYIYDYIPHNQKQNINTVCKKFNQLCDNDYKNIVKLQKFYRKNRVTDDMLWNSEQQLYRYYIVKYDDIYLKRYPEFLTKKAIYDQEKKNNSMNWINNNLNIDPDLRSRKDIYNFFVENNITCQEIGIAGW